MPSNSIQTAEHVIAHRTSADCSLMFVEMSSGILIAPSFQIVYKFCNENSWGHTKCSRLGASKRSAPCDMSLLAASLNFLKACISNIPIQFFNLTGALLLFAVANLEENQTELHNVIMAIILENFNLSSARDSKEN